MATPDDITSFFSALGLPEILLWLLTFAIVYGLMTHAKILEKSHATRAIIAIVAGFLVLMGGTPIIPVLEKMASSLILVVIGLLVLIIFLEVMKVQGKKTITEKTKEGGTIYHKVPIPFYEAYGQILAIILIIASVLIFVSAGGLELLGWKGISFGGISGNTLLFLLVIIAAIAWIIAESKGKEEK